MADEGQSADISGEHGARHLEERTAGLENKTEDAKVDLRKKAEKNKLKGRRIKRRARNRKRSSRKRRSRKRKRSSRKRRAARRTEVLPKTKRPEKTDLEQRFGNLEITGQQD